MKCPNGDESTDNDYCSVCGTIMPGQQSTPAPPVTLAPNATNDVCPKCGADRDDHAAQFCGVCAYDFVNKIGGNLVISTPVVPPPAPTPPLPDPIPSTPTPPVATSNGARMDIEVLVEGAQPLKFSLFDEESLIGRKSNSIPQAVGVSGDDAISRKQMMIHRQSDGSYTIRDLGSSNGTKVNDVLLQDGEERPLKQGDVVNIGDKTKITVVAVRQ